MIQHFNITILVKGMYSTKIKLRTSLHLQMTATGMCVSHCSHTASTVSQYDILVICKNIKKTFLLMLTTHVDHQNSYKHNNNGKC